MNDKIYVKPTVKIVSAGFLKIICASDDFDGDGEYVDDAKRRRRKISEEIFEDEEETSFWH